MIEINACYFVTTFKYTGIVRYDMNTTIQQQSLAEWDEFLEEVRLEQDWVASLSAFRAGVEVQAWEEVPYAGPNFGGQSN